MLVLNHREVEELLPIEECVGVMEDALASLARGEVHQPLRHVIRAPQANGFLGLMPAYRGGAKPNYGLKAVCVFPTNPARGLDTHLGAVLLYSGETGELLATMNASAITAIRTAAVSAVATKLLARHHAETLAIVGTGVQARSHLEAMHVARHLRNVRVAGHTFDRAKAFVERARTKYDFSIEAAPSVEAAVRDADIIVTATNALQPIVKREWIAPGTHLNVVGSSVASAREVDGATMAASSLFVDRRESTVNEAGDYLFAVREGAIGEDHIRAELGEVLIGAKPGRTHDDEITLFKSLGLAIEDLASAQYLYEKASHSERGTRIEFD